MVTCYLYVWGVKYLIVPSGITLDSYIFIRVHLLRCFSKFERCIFLVRQKCGC